MHSQHARCWTRLHAAFAGCVLTLIGGELLPAPLQAQGTPVQLSSGKVLPTPLQDDANLRTLTWVGKQILWVAGDHGTVWRSIDAGRTWIFVPLPAEYADCSIESLCFLTDRVGWIAGGRVTAGSGTPQGILLKTQDGGSTWTSVGDQPVPYLYDTKFYDDELGIARCLPSATSPAGIITTEDGGSTWTSVEAEQRVHWNSAFFFGPQDGYLVGPGGARGVLANGKLNLNSSAIGLRGFHAVSFSRDGTGWIAGDGGALLHTVNAGATWSAPPVSLPRHTQDYCDLRAVTHQGSHVWVTGFPGSVIWHSPDAGITWEPQLTGNYAPLKKVSFVDEQHGCAIGELGGILVTENGGRTWLPMRGSDRRVALMTVHGSTEHLPVQLLSRYALEDGYRTAISILTRNDIGPDAESNHNQSLLLQHATMAWGGNSGEVGWRLPLSIPGLEQDPALLTQEWSLLTESRLADVFLGHLTARIRMWRPDVIVVEDASPGDAVSAAVFEAMKRAALMAGDPAAYPDQQVCGLKPWTVSKLFALRNRDESGTVVIDDQQVLPRTGRILNDVAEEAASRLKAFSVTSGPERYQLIHAVQTLDPLQAEKTLFNDLAILVGGAARRPLGQMNAQKTDALAEQLQHLRNVRSLCRQLSERPGSGGPLIAQLHDLLAPLSPEQAARQLADLARQFRQQGDLDLAEETYAQLLQDYPDQPVAAEARIWLINQWTSLEVNYQRLRGQQATQSTLKVDPQILRTSWDEGLRSLQEAQTQTARDQIISQLQNPLQVSQTAIPIPVRSSQGVGEQTAMRLVRWQEMATQTLDQVIAEQPSLWEKPELQFGYAALMRRRLRHKQSDEIYDRYLRTISDDPWHLAARGETWLLRRGPISPKPVLNCLPTATPPVLDGLLSDACWTAAAVVKLSRHGAEHSESFVGSTSEAGGKLTITGPQSVVMISYDDRFLYIGASIIKYAGAKTDMPDYPGRVHDADLAPYDRILIHLDVDRDYNSWYTFAIDQRGWTQESCGENKKFDPPWYVAVQADDRYWRAEAAIPLEELVAKSPAKEIWSVGINRIVPGLAYETWTNSGALNPEPARFGLIQFLP